MNQKDLNRIRNLAKEQAEIANSDAMQKLFKEWNAHGSFSGDRPMVTVELWTFIQDVVPALMQCETEEGRKMVRSFGIPDDYIGVGNCILGYGDCELPKPSERTQPVIFAE